MIRRTAYLFFLLICYLFSTPARGLTAAEIVGRAEKTFLAAGTLSAEFRMEIHWQFRDSVEQKPGRIYFKRPEKYRLELGESLFLTDGKTFWRYSPKTRQVLVNDIRDAGSGFDPRQWFFKYTDRYTPLSFATAMLDGKKCHGVTLVPKTEAPFDKLLVWIDSETGLTRKIETTDKNGNTAAYFIDRVAVDPALDPGLFAFHPPIGAEVIDLRE